MMRSAMCICTDYTVSRLKIITKSILSRMLKYINTRSFANIRLRFYRKSAYLLCTGYLDKLQCVAIMNAYRYHQYI